jgi:hypothetical protein
VWVFGGKLASLKSGRKEGKRRSAHEMMRIVSRLPCSEDTLNGTGDEKETFGGSYRELACLSDKGLMKEDVVVCAHCNN